ncbi:D-proline reductase subunit gamma [Candidatus Methylomirabilis lanthanidiphila]|uniref:D-proline reductase subunit gamma n=1 Tax=Candidatus Methylomirabilis lanthanidiphila TaxID=2211376 RepID=A0A564ZK44_9BACT|nr:glycine/betaine/sarcosine/D-proline family reductase selenoprotein B [Candidatus Methylomirabilis lanthanidiphila]VUZ85012.1 D-proline reductase subunit gamma [Candidatus Methylomirabilis lanthanidiphila]
MGRLYNLTNALVVQLYKHVPWLSERWARRHRFVEGEGIPWAPLRKPLRETVIALVTTAGVHLKTQPPFDMDDPNGDPSFRVIPAYIKKEELVITHNYYDHSAADKDLNVVLPLDRLKEIKSKGLIREIAPFIYGFMGHIDGPHVDTLVKQTAPEVAALLTRDGAEAAVLTPA